MQLAMIVGPPECYPDARGLHNAINGSHHLSLVFTDYEKALNSYDSSLHSVVVILLPRNASPLDWVYVIRFYFRTSGRKIIVCLPRGVHKPCTPAHVIRARESGVRALFIIGVMDGSQHRAMADGYVERIREYLH